MHHRAHIITLDTGDPRLTSNKALDLGRGGCPFYSVARGVTSPVGCVRPLGAGFSGSEMLDRLGDGLCFDQGALALQYFHRGAHCGPRSG